MRLVKIIVVTFCAFFYVSISHADTEVAVEVACDPKNHVEATVCHYVDALNSRNISMIDELFPEGAPYIAPAQIEYVREYMPDFVNRVLQAMPDIYIRVHKMTIEEGEHVNVEWSAVGTNVGYFDDNPPRNEVVTVTGTDIFHVKFQRIISHVHTQHNLY